MNINDIEYDRDLLEFVKRIARDPQFLRLKDSFVSHSPAGEKESEKTPDAIPVAHGKWLGTRYVFNMLETLSEKTHRNRNQKPIQRKDLDMAED